MIIYKPIETHSHTIHSDGNYTPEQLMQAAKLRQLDGIIVSDHNTKSAFDYITPELEKSTVKAINAIEWTTFFGHMVVVGGNKFVDWRLATPDTIDMYIKDIRDHGGIVGIAHPFEEGDPICTGCFWMFKVNDWTNINYIEVWSTEDPLLKYKNLQAYDWWTELLNKGHKIAATAGTDWHRDASPKQLAATTYVGVTDGIVNNDNVIEALEKGRIFATMGPTIEITVNQHNRSYTIGDTVEKGILSIKVKVTNTDRRDIWEKFGCDAKQIKIINNGTIIEEIDINGVYNETLNINPKSGWIRAELYSNEYLGVDSSMVAFTSPIYIK